MSGRSATRGEGFDVRVESSLSPVDAWQAVTDWPAHGEHVPCTTVTRTADGFCGRTAVGPVGFDDPMRIEELVPATTTDAGRCRVVKTGRVVHGWAEIEVDARPSGSSVRWRECARVGPAPLRRATGRAQDAVAGLLFRRLLLSLLRRAEQAAPRSVGGDGW